MKKKNLSNIWFAAAVFTVFVLFLTACGEGTGNGPGDMTDSWPNFTNAVKLEKPEKFDNEHGPQIQWGFKFDGDAPHDVNSFQSSKFFIIASVGGGKYETPPPPAAALTLFDPNGFSSMKFKVDGTTDRSTWSHFISDQFQAKVNENWIIPFPHEIDDIVYFVYDLSIFKVMNEITSSASAPEIVFKFDNVPGEKLFGQYQAYITSASLTRGQGFELRNDAGDTNIADNTVLGWVTKNPGLTPAP